MSYSRFFIVTFVLCWTIIALGGSSAGAQIHLGIMGDSNSDEYRAGENDRGGKYASTTLNWNEQLQRYRGIDIGSWGRWSDTRRSGYEYNWALTGATAEDVVRTGQATGLAQQVAAGRINTVVLYVGANDFAVWNDTYANIYNGVLAGESLKDYIDKIVSSIATAIDTVGTTEAVNIIVTNLMDRGQFAEFIARFPDPAKRQTVTNAIVAVNAGIDNLVRARRNVALVDLYNYIDSPKYKSRINLARATVTVGHEQISFATPEDEPHHVMLSDDEHRGTVVQCLLANYIFIDPLNSKFGQRIKPFTDEECLRGPFELEFVRGKQGHELIEMNPRFPAWTDFPSQIGCNLPAMLVDMLLSRPVAPARACEPGRLFIRHNLDLVGDISQLADLSSGALINDAQPNLLKSLEPVN